MFGQVELALLPQRAPRELVPIVHRRRMHTAPQQRAHPHDQPRRVHFGEVAAAFPERREEALA